MVARDILLAELTGARYHVAHISSRHSVEMVAFAKARGLAVTAEATPHHLALADSDMASLRQQLQDEAAAAFELRRERGRGRRRQRSDRRDRDRSRAASGSEKMQEFEKCPFGILGLETAHRRLRLSSWCIRGRSG